MFGFDKQEKKLIELCTVCYPDFARIQALIADGVDINAVDSDGNNMLSEIYSRSDDRSRGKNLLETTRLFIAAGFDTVRFGWECISELAFSTYDKYVVDASRELLLAGFNPEQDAWEKTFDRIGTEESYQRCCENDHECENLFYTLYELVDRAVKGQHFADISTFHDAVGLTVRSVYADGPLSVRYCQTERTYFERLFFDCGSRIIVVEASPNIFVCSPQEENLSALTDVSESMRTIIGAKVTDVTFEHDEICEETTTYRQPVIYLKFNNEYMLRFTTDFGSVSKEETGIYFETLQSPLTIGTSNENRP